MQVLVAWFSLGMIVLLSLSVCAIRLLFTLCGTLEADSRELRIAIIETLRDRTDARDREARLQALIEKLLPQPPTAVAPRRPRVVVKGPVPPEVEAWPTDPSGNPLPEQAGAENENPNSFVPPSFPGWDILTPRPPLSPGFLKALHLTPKTRIQDLEAELSGIPVTPGNGNIAPPPDLPESTTEG